MSMKASYQTLWLLVVQTHSPITLRNAQFKAWSWSRRKKKTIRITTWVNISRSTWKLNLTCAAAFMFRGAAAAAAPPGGQTAKLKPVQSELNAHTLANRDWPTDVITTGTAQLVQEWNYHKCRTTSRPKFCVFWPLNDKLLTDWWSRDERIINDIKSKWSTTHPESDGLEASTAFFLLICFIKIQINPKLLSEGFALLWTAAVCLAIKWHTD